MATLDAAVAYLTEQGIVDAGALPPQSVVALMEKRARAYEELVRAYECLAEAKIALASLVNPKWTPAHAAYVRNANTEAVEARNAMELIRTTTDVLRAEYGDLS